MAAAVARGEVWQDSARTTLAGADDPVGSIRGELGRYYAEQSTSGNRPTLRTDGARWWLEGDGSGFLEFDLSSPPEELTYLSGCRTVSDLAGSQPIISGLYTNDVDGQAELGFHAPTEAAYFIVRTTGTGVLVTSGVSLLDADVVVDGSWSDNTLEVHEGGNLQDQRTGVEKIGTSTTIRFMARPGSGGSNLEGRIYCAAVFGFKGAGAEMTSIRQWAAARSGVVL